MSSNRVFRIATRDSLLARTQTGQSVDLLRSRTGVVAEIRHFKTIGDRVTDRPLTAFAGTGVFVKELERALLDGEADMAVHSLKDVPTDVPDELMLAAFLPREDARDLLITREGLALSDLPKGARVGTGSPRRILQLRHARPDLVFDLLRGNVDTRLRRLAEGAFDAIMLAAAGLNRLGLVVPGARPLDLALCLPAPGQGAVVFECRRDDREVRALLEQVDDEATRLAVTAERSLMRRLEGGCKIPLAAHALVTGGRLHLSALTGDEKDGRLVRLEADLNPAEGAAGAEKLADELREACLRQDIALPKQH